MTTPQLACGFDWMDKMMLPCLYEKAKPVSQRTHHSLSPMQQWPDKKADNRTYNFC